MGPLLTQVFSLFLKMAELISRVTDPYTTQPYSTQTRLSSDLTFYVSARIVLATRLAQYLVLQESLI